MSILTFIGARLKQGHRIALLVGLVFIIGVIGMLAARKAAPPSVPTPLPSVTVQPLLPTALPVTAIAYGHVISPDAVILRAQSNGIISAIHLPMGQWVAKGQILFTLQSNDTSAQLKQLAAQTALAEQIYQRDQRLRASDAGAIADIDLLQAKARYQQLLAQYQEVAAIHSIVAPVAGIVSDTPVAVGDFVTTGQALATLVDKSPLQLRYSLTLTEAQQTHVGQSVLFYVAGRATPYHATVSYRAPAANLNDYRVSIRATITDRDPPLLNTFGQVVQILNPAQATLAVPQALVHNDSNGFYVYTLTQQQVTRHYFTPGTVTANGLILVHSGLTAGTLLITSNTSALTTNEHVQVVAS